MRILAQVTPTLKITARLSSNYNVRHNSSIVHLLHRRRINNRDVRCNELSVRRFHEGRKSGSTSSKHVLRDQELEPRSLNSAFLPIALIDLNPLSSKSAKVLLIPLNWHDADEHALRNTITSIFAKPRNLQQIEAFSQALKDVPTYGDAGKKQVKRKGTEGKELLPVSKVKSVFNNPKPRQENVHFVDNIEFNVNHLDHLALALDKCLKQYCLHSMQMWTDSKIFGDNNTYYALPSDSSSAESAENYADLPSLLNIDYAKINLGDFTWHRKIPFLELQNNTLKTVNLSTTLDKKSFSTNTTQKLLGAPAENTPPAVRWFASNAGTGKCMANYDFPFLANLFGTKDLLMSCDTYNKALIEASKRREALAKIAKQLKKAQASTFSRPKVMSIKGCTLSQSIVKASAPCPAMSKPARAKPSILADDGCKKDDPCKPPKCPDPCRDEMEKLKQLKEEEMRRKKKKMPTGCVSPKCKKEDRCGKLKDPKKKCDAVKPEMKLSCKKDDPCKPAQCPDPCKDEMEKLERLKNEELKRKKGKIPTGCISPKCKKQDKCKNPKKSPCKKLQGSNTKLTTVQCAKKSPSDSCTKGKEKGGKKKGHPCDDDKEEKEYKPKCNKDPCKGDQPCGGPPKKKAASTPKSESVCKMKAGGSDPCKKDSVTKQAACKKNDKKKKKNDGCKKKKDDPCGKKKKDDPCGKKKKDDPCGKKKKDDPCGKKKKDDPCGKKKKDDPCGKKKKDDPCGKKKKADPCGKKKKDDPCGKKKKDDPCGKKKKDDPCGKKKKDDPCGKKKKDDPCGKKKKKCPEDRLPCDNKKDDPCKKKTSSPCNNKKNAKSKSSSSKKAKPTKSKSSCSKPKKPTSQNCKKTYSTSSQIRSTVFASPLRRFYSNFMSLPLLKNKNMFSYSFTRHFSSKKGGEKGDKKGKKGKKDLGRVSQCHAAATHVPPKRKNVPNPHPKDGLRKCYPTYDMDCRKLCKDARKTSCKKFAFLKDTDDKKRSGRK